MIRVGLTGGIGAGKSTVAKTLVAQGAHHIDADRIAREVVEPGTPGLAALVDAFGPEILDSHGALNRPALAARAFADEEGVKKLNAITHPLIGARTQELTAAAPADAVILHDVPLLVEGNMAPFYDAVIVVHADAESRLHRLVSLRGMDDADARKRIEAQASDAQRRAVADIWLDNSGTPEELAEQALQVWNDRVLPLRENHSRGVAAPLPTAVVDADPAWAVIGTRVVNRLWALLGAGAKRIEHVGPTAEPGTPAPPVIDVAVIVADDAAADEAARLLHAGGFPVIDAEGGVTPARTHGAADPGRPVRIHLRVED
ncbi:MULTISPECIES: dephospho-CoA kinase [unclassified Gordonia (in: high G+C Gram-positive bacteria)]|uniref:dephospho-CoA kinase n=1 Tax=unclassified Gordonia (in: high G+C Gram-positive bacteria) TaxID=2657482 RepID=UPI001FFF3FA5|nr:dephospho-CoA kinase [Gordonia sp. PP30]UQE73493.1 dephospho-CoA kinase [Gordonia sp. PP30]